MAKHATKAPGTLRLTWDRLGSRGLWSIKLFWFGATIYGILTFLMDFLRTSNPSWLWFVTYLGSLVAVVLMAAVARFWIVPKVPEKFLAIFNLSFASVIAGFKNVIVALLAVALGLESNVDYLYRFLGGTVIGLLVLTSFAAVTGARGAHEIALRRLTAIQNDLLGSKENLELVLKEELEKLQERSRETVLPKIRQISELLGDDSKTAQIIAELEETVRNRVRPLMDEIANTAKSGFTQITETGSDKSRVSTPKSFVMRDGLRPLTFAFYALPAVAFMAFYFQGFDGAVAGFLATASFALTLWVVRLFLPKRATKSLHNTALLVLIALVAPIPSLYLLGGIIAFDARESVVVPLVAWAFDILVVIVLSPLVILDNERVKLEAKIAEENIALEKEITIFEQRLWVFRKRWLFMLHGTVQSALTAALTRLQTFSDTDNYQSNLVRADLERAEKALQKAPSAEIDFVRASEELRDAWAGVCSVTIDVDLRASRALSTNQGSAYCVNEILKEAVGNAVRHGSANAVLVAVTRDKDDFIDVTIQNDGTAPRKGWKKGIGSRMLDDITLNWSLTRSGRLTTLTARLPL